MKFSGTRSHYPLIKGSIPKFQVSVANILERADREICPSLYKVSIGQLHCLTNFSVKGQTVNILGFVAITQLNHCSAKQP